LQYGGDYLNPGLARGEVFFIKPWLEFLLPEASIDISHARFIFTIIAEENASHNSYLKHNYYMSHTPA
jgi:hypothetical protein